MTIRWTFTDPNDTNPGTASWTIFRNPSEMTSPIPTRPVTAAGTTAGAMVAYEGVPQPHQWSFKGPLLNRAEYTALKFWYQKQNRFTIKDHLGRVFTVAPVNLDVTPKNLPGHYWRADYEFFVITLGYDETSLVADIWGS